MLRISLRSFLITAGVVSICIGLSVNWHLRSMAQYRELRALSDRPLNQKGLYFVLQEDIVKYEPRTELYRRVSPVAPGSRGSGKWLCKILNYQYALRCTSVFVHEATEDAAIQVSRLKGVKQICLMQTHDDETTDHWKELFPNARILNRHDMNKHKLQTIGWNIRRTAF